MELKLLTTILLTFNLLLNKINCKIYDRCELAKELKDLHNIPFDQLATWLCIIKHESRFNTSANNLGSGDHGLFQISQLYWCSPPGYACGLSCDLLRDDDIEDDVICAKRIYREHKILSGDGFNAWVVYNSYCKNDNYVKTMLDDCFRTTTARQGKAEIDNEVIPQEITTKNDYVTERAVYSYFWEKNLDKYFPKPTPITYFWLKDLNKYFPGPNDTVQTHFIKEPFSAVVRNVEVESTTLNAETATESAPTVFFVNTGGYVKQEDSASDTSIETTSAAKSYFTNTESYVEDLKTGDNIKLTTPNPIERSTRKPIIFKAKRIQKQLRGFSTPKSVSIKRTTIYPRRSTIVTTTKRWITVTTKRPIFLTAPTKRSKTTIRRPLLTLTSKITRNQLNGTTTLKPYIKRITTPIIKRSTPTTTSTTTTTTRTSRFFTSTNPTTSSIITRKNRDESLTSSRFKTVYQIGDYSFGYSSRGYRIVRN